MTLKMFKGKGLRNLLGLAAMVLTMPVAMVVTAPAAQAAEILPGCYQRIYSSGHLAGQPAQVVAAMRMKVGGWQTEVSRGTTLEVVMANQGHVRGSMYAGRTLSQFMFCGTEGRSDLCVTDCNSGSLEVRKNDSNGMTFRTRFLLVGEVADCGGSVDLAEYPNQWVSYKLNRVPDVVCNGM